MSFPRLALVASALLVWILTGCTALPANPLPKIDLGELETEETEVDRELVKQDNCHGTAELSYEVSGSREISFELNTGGQFEVNADGQIGLFGTDVGLGAAVAANVGVTYGTTQMIQKTIRVGAAPGTYVLHVISHRVLWKTGLATIMLGGQTRQVPFQFPKDFSLVAVSVDRLPCPGETNPTSEPTPLEAAATDPSVPPTAVHADTPTQAPTEVPTGTPTGTPTEAAVAQATVPPTATPTATSTPEPPTSTPTATSTFTPLPPTATPTIVLTATLPPPPPPTSTPAPTPCATATDPDLAGYWRPELGCPVSGSNIVWSSYTPFEKGFMMWRSDTGRIYGFFNGIGWADVADVFRDGMPDMPEPNRGNPPPGLIHPIRGTGLVWATNEEFFRGLGWATSQQRGFCAEIQNFANGFISRESGVGQCSDLIRNEPRSSRSGEAGFNFRYVVAVLSNRAWYP